MTRAPITRIATWWRNEWDYLLILGGVLALAWLAGSFISVTIGAWQYAASYH